MKLKIVKLVSIALAAAMLLSMTACGSEGGKSASEGPFTNMETVDLNGNSVDSSVFADKKLTLINAWNLGCTACIEEMPTLAQISRDYADKGVAVMCLYYNFGSELTDSERQEVADITANAGADFPQLMTSDAMMNSSELKRMSVFPLTFFVDSQGNIIDSVAGAYDYEGWSKLIDDTLKKVDGNA